MMGEISFISSKLNLWKKGGGILITLITLAIIEIVAWTWIRIPNPPPILLLTVVFSTFVGNLRQGLISAAITWLYTLYYFSFPGQLFHYTEESFLRIIVLTGVIPAMALLVGILKRRSDQVAEVSKTSAILQAKLTEDQKLGEELQRREKRLHIALEAANAGAWEWDVKTNKVIWSDDNYRVLGLEPGSVEASYERWIECVHPEDREYANLEVSKSIEKKQKLDIEFRIIKPDGSICWINDRGEFAFDEKGQPIRMYGIQIDITKRNRVETERNRLFNLSLDMLCIAGFDGYFKQLNPAWEKTLSWEREELMAKPFLEFVHPEDREATIDAAKNLSEGKASVTFENRYLCKDGSYKWLSWNSFPLVEEKLIFAVTRDITERKKAEELLLEKEHLLSESQRIAHIGSWGWDLTGPIKWTDETYRIYGVSPETFTPTIESLVNLLHPEDRPAMQRWLEACGAGQSPDDLEFRVILPGGSVRLLRGRGELIYDTENRPSYMYGTVQDITEPKRAEAERRIINEELLVINRIITTTTTTTGVKGILEKVLDEALHITGLEGGTICMVTPDETLDLAVHRETSEATILDLTTNRIKIGECLCGECARDHKSLILWDREAVLKFSTREAQRGEDIRFHAAFPLIIGGRCLGVLCVFTRTDKKPLERRLKLLETVTSQIAIALENALLFEETTQHAAILEDRVKERTKELEKRIAEIERMNKLFVGRELDMIKLKKEVKELEERRTKDDG